MKGDFSRLTFDRKKHYNAVLLQQGRVLTDADPNEGQAIQAYLHGTTAIDVIGRTGVPRVSGGFSVGLSSDSKQLTLSAGQMYVDGILLENEAAYQTQPGDFSPPSSSGRYLVFLEAWKRLVTAIDDPDIKERALGGPDTTTRLQTTWRLRLKSTSATDCEAVYNGPPIVPAPTGQLRVTTSTSNGGDNLCVLPPESGYTGLENQLYRVEIQRSGERDNAGNRATFKWSRDNGSVAVKVLDVTTTTILVEHLGLDETLGFANDDWIELVDTPTDLDGRTGFLTQIDHIDSSANEIVVKGSLPAVDKTKPLKLRRWDQSGSLAGADGIPLGGGAFDLENGIQIEFGAGTYRAGDYWIFPARTAIQSQVSFVDWPRDGSGSELFTGPHGVESHYAPLALVNFNTGSGTFSLVADGDCRRIFPPLTAITADDVSFDNNTCNLQGAETVQDALDLLCQRSGGVCEIEVTPGQDLAVILEALPVGQDAHICLQTGTYTIDRTVDLAEKGHLLIQGAGYGTRLVATDSESALRFTDCKSVSVRDLHAEAGKLGSQKNVTEHLNGVLMFQNCPLVTVERVSLRCPSGLVRSAACISVFNQDAVPGVTLPLDTVRIQDCMLQVGDRQVGILLVNVARSQVEDNLVCTPQSPVVNNQWYLNDKYRGMVAKSLMSGMKVTKVTDAPPGGTNATVNMGGFAVHFNTPVELAPDRNNTAWNAVFNPDVAEQPFTEQAVNLYVNKQIDKLLTGRISGTAIPVALLDLIAKLAQPNKAAAWQGIVVGGRRASEVRILNNSVRDAIMGIHVGLSHFTGNPADRDVAGTVIIQDNSVQVMLPSAAVRERHAIMVGNCRSLLIQDNHVVLSTSESASNLRIEGLRVWGVVDRRVIVRGNHIESFPVGIHFTPLNDFSQPLWIITDNIAVNASLVVQILRDPDPSWSATRQAAHLARRTKIKGQVRGLAGNL